MNMTQEAKTAELYFDPIYYVIFSATGKPVGNPVHMSPVDAAWHVRSWGAGKTTVLRIIASGPPVNVASLVPIDGEKFLAENLAALEERDRLEERARQTPTGVREAPACSPLMK
jgi:hypothetical protein